MREACDNHLKESGHKLDVSIAPRIATNQKTIATLTGGDVLDVVFMDAPSSIIPRHPGDGKRIDVTPIVTPHEPQLCGTAKLGSTCHNKATKKRSRLCPIKQGAMPFHLTDDTLAPAIDRAFNRGHEGFAKIAAT